ncbi:MAG TPA: type 4a pilus biogenesis protein PilO [Bryobacteraceae bacterium]|nr:type 4a pilus biogenesis protein PilO [Bryobacteraceae bacterium]
MRRNFSPRLKLGDPKVIARTVVMVLGVANVIAAGLVLFPPGGSAEELERQRATLIGQVRTLRERVELIKQHADAVEKGRAEGDQFLSQYFLANRTAFSTLLSELESAAKQSQIKPRDNAFSMEPVEGSDTLSMMSITAGFEGKYADLMRFVHAIDQSQRLLIIESLTAAPQQNSDILSVSMKLNTFVREDQAREAGSQ